MLGLCIVCTREQLSQADLNAAMDTDSVSDKAEISLLLDHVLAEIRNAAGAIVAPRTQPTTPNELDQTWPSCSFKEKNARWDGKSAMG